MRMRELSIAFASFGAVAALSGGAVALASPGQATSQSPPNVTDQAPPSAAGAPAITGPYAEQDFVITGGPSAPGAQTETFHCIHQVNQPHHSSHNPGNVNVVQTISCYYATNGVKTGNATVTNIGMRTALYRDGKLVKDGPLNKKQDGYKRSDSAAVTCVPGLYQGWGVVNFTTPPSWGSQPERLQEWGPQNNITSCN